jgi:hypothetical protein
MNGPLDPNTAAVELTSYVKEVLHPPPEGAALHAILGAHILKARFHEAGFAIVPLVPTQRMVKAFRRRWFGRFSDRYEAMLVAAWPGGSSP